MRHIYFILLFLLSAASRVTGQDTTFTRAPTNRYLASEQIKALKLGALVVRLKTNDKSVEAYRRAGQTELADKITIEREKQNQKIAEAFKYYFTFCKVYFIYAKNTESLLKREPKIFLNEKLELDTTIKLTEDYFLIAEYGSYTTNERVDEYHYSGVYKTQPSNSTASSSALVVIDTTLNQLQEPFPFYEPVYLGGFIKSVEQLSHNMEKSYSNFTYKEQLNREKMKKRAIPKN